MMNDETSIKMIESKIRESVEVKNNILLNRSVINAIHKTSIEIINAYRNHKKILIAGNGGSAADAQHMAAELVGRFGFDRPALNASALTTDSSIVTAISNDYGFEEVFSRQIDALGVEGDVFIAISTSGNSENILRAAKKAKSIGMTVVCLTGKNMSQLDDISNYSIKIPSVDTPRIQEAHLLIEHILCNLVEQILFKK